MAQQGDAILQRVGLIVVAVAAAAAEDVHDVVGDEKLSKPRCCSLQDVAKMEKALNDS